MDEESEQQHKRPAVRRTKERSGSMMLQCTESAEDCEIHRKSTRTSVMAGTSRSYQDQIRTSRLLKRKMMEEKEEGSAPAKCRKEEPQEQVPTREASSSVDILIETSSSSMMLQSAEPIKDSTPKRRKRVKKETRRKWTRVSKTVGPSKSHENHTRIVRRLRRKITDEGEGSPTPAERKNEGLLQQVVTKEPQSSVVISTEKSSSMMLPNSESAEGCSPKKNTNSGDEIHRNRIRTSEIAGTSRSCQDQIRTRRLLKRKMIEEKEEGSTPAKFRKEELQEQVPTRESSSSVDILIETSSSSSMMPQSAEPIKDSTPKRRKRVKKETHRKWTRVSKIFGPSKSHQNHTRNVRRLKRKITEEGEGSSTPAERKNNKLMLSSNSTETTSSVDISTESNSSNLVLWSSGIDDLQKTNLKGENEDTEEPQLRNRRKNMRKRTKEKMDPQRAKFLEKYTELHQLGKGGFGYVFAGYRKVDKLPVAVKHIPNEKVGRKHKDENGRKMALEVAIMLKMNNITSSSGQLATVSLLDWYELKEELLLVMERPMPSEDLNVFLDKHEGCLNEEETKIILKQLVEATIQLQDAKIFHRDIKVENVLIERSSEGLRVYLIDFGLSCFDHGRKFTIFKGTPALQSPEYRTKNKYSAGPTTVWQLGVIMFELLHNKNFETNNFLKKKLKISKRLSKDCQDILTRCLKKHPEDRPTLEELHNHPWFSQTREARKEG